ncbi:asparagine synthase (glutamine-hydrolyzing), partial [Candidatus Aminicenantes bacterium AC-334-E05]|nr:asparagine synthase (glutamine-hydrolyzing) [Candidatus Aminicenantes bacterium AC-334-E05]
KPLHYFHKNNLFIFASEIKSILTTDYYKREIDFDALAKYFAFEYIPAPQTIFKGIKKLLPGHLIVMKNGEVKIKKYWDIKYEYQNRSEDYYKEQIYERLKEAVKKRLISDVPLGVFLSGGIDSSTVTYLMSKVSNSKIKTFSIGFEEQSFNELEYARVVAEHIKSEHTEFVVKSKMVKELVPVLMEYLDEPLADASIIPTYIISKLAREFVTVALAGDGGDELFAGYDTYKAYQIARLYRKVPKFLRDSIIKRIVYFLPASSKRLSFEFKAKKFISGIDYPPEISNYIWWGAYNPSERDRLFSEELKSLFKDDPYSPVFYHLKNYKPENMLDRLAYLDIKLYLQDDLLVKVDRMSMANSLEIRVPFLDHTFVEFATSIPSNLKLNGLKTKYILKKAMEPHLPKKVLYRKKIGFDIPLGVWIRKELKDFVLEVLSRENLNRHGFFNYSYIEKILKEHFSGKHNHRQLLWPLIIFQFWYNRYINVK